MCRQHTRSRHKFPSRQGEDLTVGKLAIVRTWQFENLVVWKLGNLSVLNISILPSLNLSFYDKFPFWINLFVQLEKHWNRTIVYSVSHPPLVSSPAWKEVLCKTTATLESSSPLHLECAALLDWLSSSCTYGWID